MKLDLTPGLTLLVGANGQGKTNLMEAIHCLSGLGSPRGPDAALVRQGSERAYVNAQITRAERRLEIDIEIQSGRGTRALVNRTPVASLRSLSEISTSVFFGPDELALCKGGPDLRRRFMDDLAIKMRPAVGDVKREWERVLRQRNSLLKSAPRQGDPDALGTLQVWNESFCRLGGALTKARLTAVTTVLPATRRHYERISGGDELGLSYHSSWVTGDIDESSVDEDELTQFLQTSLEAVKSREFERGVSLVGPHRDDLQIEIRSQGATQWRDARSHASQGEQRTSALALKLGEYEVLTDVLGEPPILLLDDVLSELDDARRRLLMQIIKGEGQTLMSSAEPNTAESAEPARVFEVVGGQVKPRG